jgi:5-methylcytosine-specific restriction endonuclease McrA
MLYDDQTLRKIYDRTNGKCHLCHKKLSFTNHGQGGAKGAWEVEHSVPRANGGTDHLNNLFPACIACNRSKGTYTARTARSWSGHSKAPMSRERKDRARRKNTLTGAALGTILGLMINPGVALIGLGLGALVGHSSNPEA